MASFALLWLQRLGLSGRVSGHRVVEYVTGTNRAPAGGWQNLRGKGGSKAPFTIYNLDEVRNQMPRAHTW